LQADDLVIVGRDLIDFLDPSLTSGGGTGVEPGGWNCWRGAQAGPAPVLGTFDQPGAEGIAFDVAEHDAEMLILFDWKGFETTLPYVAAGVIVAVMTPDVRGHQPLHPGAEVAIPARPEDQVEMVGNEAIAEDAHRSFATGQFEQFDEGGVVGGLVKDLRVSVTAIEDVVAVIGLRGSWNVPLFSFPCKNSLPRIRIIDYIYLYSENFSGMLHFQRV
jgi:hypothetical protein